MARLSLEILQYLKDNGNWHPVVFIVFILFPACMRHLIISIAVGVWGGSYGTEAFSVQLLVSYSFLITYDT